MYSGGRHLLLHAVHMCKVDSGIQHVGLSKRHSLVDLARFHLCLQQSKALALVLKDALVLKIGSQGMALKISNLVREFFYGPYY